MDHSAMDDVALVALAGSGNHSAQQVLYNRYIQRITAYFLYQIHNEHTAEDLAQETFIRAFNGISRFRGDASFKNWLYRIAKNRLADFYRDHNSLVAELDEALPPRQLQRNINDDELAATEERRARKRLGSIFVHLPERYKKILVLRFLKGFSLKETAAAMSLTLTNIKVLQHRALKMARQRSELAVA